MIPVYMKVRPKCRVSKDMVLQIGAPSLLAASEAPRYCVYHRVITFGIYTYPPDDSVMEKQRMKFFEQEMHA